MNCSLYAEKHAKARGVRSKEEVCMCADGVCRDVFEERAHIFSKYEHELKVTKCARLKYSKHDKEKRTEKRKRRVLSLRPVYHVIPVVPMPPPLLLQRSPTTELCLSKPFSNANCGGTSERQHPHIV